jgi:Carbohydrate binding module (family 6)
LITANKFRGESHPGNDSLVRVTGTKVNYIKNGNWIEFPDLNFASGAKSITLNASSPITHCTVELYVNTRDSHNLIGTVPIGSTSSFTNPLDFTMNTLKPVKGLQKLIIKFVHPNNTGYIMDLYSFTLNDLNADFTVNDIHSVKNSTNVNAPKVLINTDPLNKMIEYITHGTSVTYSDVDLAGATSVTINASSLNTGGKIIVRSKIYNKDYCNIIVTPTPGWTTYQDFSANIITANLPTTTDHVELVFESNANPPITTPLFNLKSVKFNK